MSSKHTHQLHASGSPAMPMGGAKAAELSVVDTRETVHRLIIIFAAWKSLLLAIAFGNPGTGYDTSTVILLRQYDRPASQWLAGHLERLVLGLTRWDAIYFSSISERGYVFEQEWAFGGALARAPALFVPFTKFLHPSPIVQHALAAILLSHICHFVSVLALWSLTLDLLSSVPERRRHSIAFAAACLHVVSPAGIFLSSPNNESAFTCFTFLGTLAYVNHHIHNAANSTPSGTSILAGISWGIAASARSNGVLAGLLPLLDLYSLLRQPIDNIVTVAIGKTLIAGILIGVGTIGPQVVAWEVYCTDDEVRPWCSNIPPSIYQWVQSYYWNVGPFRYWTPGNIPLFLIAMPMLAILAYTSLITLRSPADVVAAAIGPSKQTTKHPAPKSSRPRSPDPSHALEQSDTLPTLLARLAIPQLVISLLALTTFHVQIINRLSAAYPLWYIILSIGLHCEAEDLRTRVPRLGWHVEVGLPKAVVYGMVAYALVQAGLYAAFLPPA